MGDGAGEPVIHLFKLFSYYGEIRETDVISMWFNHTGWWINGAWLIHLFKLCRSYGPFRETDVMTM